MTADTTNVLELPNRLERGEVRFSINLALIDDVPALYELVGSLGFTQPQIVLMHCAKTSEVHLLLHRQVYSQLDEPPHDLYEHEQQVLANAINTDAMHFRCGLTKQVRPIAA